MARQFSIYDPQRFERVDNLLAAGESIEFGDLVQCNSSGYIEQATDDSNKMILGIAMENVDNSGGGDGDESILIYTNIIVDVKIDASIGQSDMYHVVCVKDNETVQTCATSTNQNGSGVLVSFDSVNLVGKIKL